MSAAAPGPSLAPVSVARARFLPVIGDSMAPTLTCGHMVAVVPVKGYRCDGLYVLDLMGNGSVQIMRCQTMGQRAISLRYDTPAYGQAGEAGWVCKEWFESAVLGQVAGILEITDSTLLEN